MSALRVREHASMSNGHGIVHGAVVALALCFAPISVHAQRDPSSRCAALAPEDQSPLTPPPTRRPRELLVFAASWVAAPLDAEHAALAPCVQRRRFERSPCRHVR